MEDETVGEGVIVEGEDDELEPTVGGIRELFGEENDKGMIKGLCCGSEQSLQVKGSPLRCSLWNHIRQTLHKVGLLLFLNSFLHWKHILDWRDWLEEAMVLSRGLVRESVRIKVDGVAKVDWTLGVGTLWVGNV